MSNPFTVYDLDEDDEGCIRLHVNTNVKWPEDATDILETRLNRVASLIDNLDDSGALDDLLEKEAKNE